MLHFTKMHGAGNDYIYVNGFKEKVENPEKISIALSDRHFGIGSDGLVLILPSETCDFKMRMFNADGSEGKMCGNASRCIGKYVYENGLTGKTEITLETLSGVKKLKLFPNRNGKVDYVEVDMGKALLKTKDIPMNSDKEHFVNSPLEVGGKEYRVTCVSMGNPHAVIFVDETDNLKLEEIGPLFENHPVFPEKVNTEFVKILSPEDIRMRVWERGSGETLACGTGACASVVASVLCGFCGYNIPIRVHLKGGMLTITYQSNGTVIMGGNAVKVFDGEIDIDNI